MTPCSLRGGAASLATVISALAAAAPAAAMTDGQARAELARLRLSPAPLYPAKLPERLIDANVYLTTQDGYSVSWDRGRTVDQRVGGISLSRTTRRGLREDMRVARSRGYHPRRIRVGRRTVWRLCGHICGFSWIERSRTYRVYGIYYVGDDNGAAVTRDQKRIIRSLRPLR